MAIKDRKFHRKAPNGGVDVARDTDNFQTNERRCPRLASDELLDRRRDFHAERKKIMNDKRNFNELLEQNAQLRNLSENHVKAYQRLRGAVVVALRQLVNNNTKAAFRTLDQIIADLDVELE